MTSKKYFQSIYKFNTRDKSYLIEDMFKNHYISYIFEPITDVLIYKNKYNIKFSIKNTHEVKTIKGSFNIEISIPNYKAVNQYVKYELLPQQNYFVTVIDNVIYGEDSLIITVDFIDGPSSYSN